MVAIVVKVGEIVKVVQFQVEVVVKKEVVKVVLHLSIIVVKEEVVKVVSYQMVIVVVMEVLIEVANCTLWTPNLEPEAQWRCSDQNGCCCCKGMRLGEWGRGCGHRQSSQHSSLGNS